MFQEQRAILKERGFVFVQPRPGSLPFALPPALPPALAPPPAAETHAASSMGMPSSVALPSPDLRKRRGESSATAVSTPLLIAQEEVSTKAVLLFQKLSADAAEGSDALFDGEMLEDLLDEYFTLLSFVFPIVCLALIGGIYCFIHPPQCIKKKQQKLPLRLSSHVIQNKIK